MSRRQLHEDDGFDFAGAMSDAPYGMHFASSNQLYSTFVKPFVDVVLTAAGKTAELSARAQAAVKVAFEAVATSVIPIVSSDYGEIFAEEKSRLDSIKQRYADVYGSTWAALGGTDATVAAFMFAPWAFLGAGLIRRSPAAALSLVGILGGGNAGIERFVLQVKSKFGRSDSQASRVNSREESRMDSWAFESGRFVGLVLTEKKKTDKGNASKDALVKLLLSPKLRAALRASRVVKRMEEDGHKIVERTLRTVLKRARAVAGAKSIDDVERAIGKQLASMAQLKKMSPTERAGAEAAILSQIKAATKKFYTANLKKQAQAAIDAGVEPGNPYVRAYEAAIKQIEGL